MSLSTPSPTSRVTIQLSRDSKTYHISTLSLFVSRSSVLISYSTYALYHIVACTVNVLAISLILRISSVLNDDGGDSAGEARYPCMGEKRCFQPPAFAQVQIVKSLHIEFCIHCHLHCTSSSFDVVKCPANANAGPFLIWRRKSIRNGKGPCSNI